ncbi:hypothetical protein FNV43_RR24418 [Rhamnella rubrinervis]|uniref:Wound-induced protein 1 n=1 Tax=Rhamnella rubrinervis TaxID=2594499 RepID=A0A8K0GQ79_9ROSA|nr:hypothetical protein FNV43_RR24418 [Rhamnella rubrinervis]
MSSELSGVDLCQFSSSLYWLSLFELQEVGEENGVDEAVKELVETLEESDSSNQGVVLALYDALSSRDVDKVHQIVSPDLDWWFHGPPSHQYLMRLLTGAPPSKDTFRFVPQSIASFGPTVLVEGCDHGRSISWVHAWTVTHGIITQVREYFNTSLTVTRLGNSSSTRSSPSKFASPSSSSSSSASEITSYHCPSVWESSVSDPKSVPGLVLAI